jgi:signal transduction histidine kinase
MQRTLFRMVQEGLANVHRHARASHVSVQLRWIGGRVHVIIADDGCGMRVKRHGSPMRLGVGLRGVRARARQFGGDLKIRSGRQGTTIHVVMKSSRHSKGLRWVVRREGEVISSKRRGATQRSGHRPSTPMEALIR